MKVVGYVRVSSAKQLDEGLGLEIQEAAVRRFCEENGHRLVAVHRDEAKSGTLADRVGLGEVLAAVEDGKAEAVIVYRLDRLARDLILQETIIERLARADRRVLSVMEPDVDGPDPTRVLIRQVLGAISQYERAVISARMMAGRRAKAAKGGFAGFGAPAYGYRTQGRELVADDVEQANIVRIAELHADGRSLREIARVLDAEGRKPKRAACWQPAVLARMVKRIDADAAAKAELLAS